MTVDEFFTGYDRAKTIFDALYQVVKEMGPVELHVTKSQVAFVHGNAFAWAWIPGKYLKGKIAPLVLTIGFYHRDLSPRWKEVVEPYPGNFTHHLELFSIGDVDNEVRDWLLQARTSRGEPGTT